MCRLRKNPRSRNRRIPQHQNNSRRLTQIRCTLPYCLFKYSPGSVHGRFTNALLQAKSRPLSADGLFLQAFCIFAILAVQYPCIAAPFWQMDVCIDIPRVFLYIHGSIHTIHIVIHQIRRGKPSFFIWLSTLSPLNTPARGGQKACFSSAESQEYIQLWRKCESFRFAVKHCKT